MSSLHQFTISKSRVNRCIWCFPFNNDRLPGPAAPRPMAPEKTHVPSRSEGRNEGRRNVATAGRQGFSLPKMSKRSQKVMGRCGEQWGIRTWLNLEPLNNLSNFWVFFGILTAKTSQVRISRSTSRNEAMAKMRFRGQVAGDVKLLQ